jgi:hypothetical protein
MISCAITKGKPCGRQRKVGISRKASKRVAAGEGETCEAPSTASNAKPWGGGGAAGSNMSHYRESHQQRDKVIYGDVGTILPCRRTGPRAHIVLVRVGVVDVVVEVGLAPCPHRQASVFSRRIFLTLPAPF